eukprot:2623813-Rhodomonas_salina.1
MQYTFRDSSFNGDISKWDVSSVTDMSYLFYDSSFNGDLSKWDVSSVRSMDQIVREAFYLADGCDFLRQSVLNSRCTPCNPPIPANSAFQGSASPCLWSCNADFYESAGSCAACPAHLNSPQGSDDITDCTCDADFYETAGSCAACPANTVSPRGSDRAVNCTCGPGHTGPDGGPCQQCETG